MAEVRKYDKQTDQQVQARYQPIFDMDGKRVVMPGAFKARVQAQMGRDVMGRFVAARMKGRASK